MKCARCHNNDSKVVDSRDIRDGDSIRRRRECLKCGFRFTTYERTETVPLLVVKKDGSREEYSREKIRKGVTAAFTKRPVSAETIEKLIDAVETEVFSKGDLEIPSGRIGECIMEQLRQADPLAYIRFASVYREFADLDTMLHEIQKLKDIEAKDAKSKSG
jgi:transcriptional repressor NrdR